MGQNSRIGLFLDSLTILIFKTVVLLIKRRSAYCYMWRYSLTPTHMNFDNPKLQTSLFIYLLELKFQRLFFGC